ncbi:unnamed protein product, partial [marine sediment metagenome]
MVEHWIRFKKIIAQGGIRKIIPIKTFLLPPCRRGHIDCLVIGKKNYRKAERVLEKEGFKKGRRFYRDRGKRFWSFPDNKRAAAVHLHKICGWAGIGYLEPEKIWERKRTKEIGGHEIDLPSYEDEII